MIFFLKMAGGHLDGFLVPKYHTKAFIVLLSDSKQSQLHFATSDLRCRNEVNFRHPKDEKNVFLL